MQVPIEISFTGTDASESIKQLVDEEAAKLERVCDHISSCRVAVDKHPRPQRSRNPWRVRVEVHVPPRHTLVAVHEPHESNVHEPLSVVVKHTFDSMRKQLRKLVEKQQRHVKTHPEQESVALVARLFPEEGYGFIKTPEGRDIYFHRNAVLHQDFERLEPGTAVRFVEAEGEEGPQASTVQVVDKPGSRVSDEDHVQPPYGWERE